MQVNDDFSFLSYFFPFFFFCEEFCEDTERSLKVKSKVLNETMETMFNNKIISVANEFVFDALMCTVIENLYRTINTLLCVYYTVEIVLRRLSRSRIDQLHRSRSKRDDVAKAVSSHSSRNFLSFMSSSRNEQTRAST